jgi:hypothetical protein
MRVVVMRPHDAKSDLSSSPVVPTGNDLTATRTASAGPVDARGARGAAASRGARGAEPGARASSEPAARAGLRRASNSTERATDVPSMLMLLPFMATAAEAEEAKS